MRRSTRQETVAYFLERGGGWEYDAASDSLNFYGKDCWIWIGFRPHYCDRGSLTIHVETMDQARLTIDAPDMFPRMFFHASAAWAEIETWIDVRKQRPDDVAHARIEVGKRFRYSPPGYGMRVNDANL